MRLHDLNRNRARGAQGLHENALDLDPKLAHAWYGKGSVRCVILTARKRRSQAYDNALDLDPGLVPAWNGKAMR